MQQVGIGVLTLSHPARFLYSHADAHRSTTALGAPTMQLAADVRLCFLHGWCQRSGGHGFCDRVWARSPSGEAAGRTVPLSLRLPWRTESRGAAQRSSVFWKAQLTISRRRRVHARAPLA